MLELIAGDPNGSQGDLVRGAYGLMQKLAKVGLCDMACEVSQSGSLNPLWATVLI